MTEKSFADTVSFLNEIDRSRNIEDINKKILGRLSVYGVESIAASLLPSINGLSRFGRRFLVMTHVPDDWQKHYLRRRYALHDPVVEETLRRPTAFGWHDEDFVPRRRGMAARIMDEASDVGLRRGFTVPMTTIEGAQGGVTFAGRHMELAPADRSLLTLVAAYAFGHALLIHDHHLNPKGTLSRRERETLHWLAEGKTDAEIGALMKITEHGVDRHMRGIRAKLGTRNRTHAVAEGFRHGLIG